MYNEVLKWKLSIKVCDEWMKDNVGRIYAAPLFLYLLANPDGPLIPGNMLEIL